MKYNIICQIDGRIIASLSLDGELTIYHDHFLDDEGFDVTKFLNAFDKWYIRRVINHNSKEGVNQKTVDAITKMQKANPGKIIV